MFYLSKKNLAFFAAKTLLKPKLACRFVPASAFHSFGSNRSCYNSDEPYMRKQLE